MKTKILRVLKLFWLDEAFFERATRSLLFGWAVTGLAFADQLAGFVQAPGIVKWIRVSAAIAAALAGLIKAGDKNPEPEEKPQP